MTHDRRVKISDVRGCMEYKLHLALFVLQIPKITINIFLFLFNIPFIAARILRYILAI